VSVSAPEAAAAGGARRLRVVIADDEALARDSIRLCLQEAGDAEVVAECANGHEAVDAIRRYAPDLVFLDIQMPGFDGFRVIEAIGPDAMPAPSTRWIGSRRPTARCGCTPARGVS